MATVEQRKSHGQTVYYVKIRRKEYAPQLATLLQGVSHRLLV
jgi:hypothetical protein